MIESLEDHRKNQQEKDQVVSSMDGVDGRIRCSVFIQPEQHLVYGGDKISKILHRSPKEIQNLVADRGLKAWQENGGGKWRALMVDLLEFNLAERDKRF